MVLATGFEVAIAPRERRRLFADDEWNANFVGDWAGNLRFFAQDGARLDLALICWMSKEEFVASTGEAHGEDTTSLP